MRTSQQEKCLKRGVSNWKHIKSQSFRRFFGWRFQVVVDIVLFYLYQHFIFTYTYGSTPQRAPSSLTKQAIFIDLLQKKSEEQRPNRRIFLWLFSDTDTPYRPRLKLAAKQRARPYLCATFRRRNRYLTPLSVHLCPININSLPLSPTTAAATVAAVVSPPVVSVLQPFHPSTSQRLLFIYFLPLAFLRRGAG